MSPHLRNYCEDCEWSASTETYSRNELSGAAIEHVVEAGHDINSELIADFSAHFSDETGSSDTVDWHSNPVYCT